jgi:hypothetical protein
VVGEDKETDMQDAMCREKNNRKGIESIEQIHPFLSISWSLFLNIFQATETISLALSYLPLPLFKESI